MQSDCPKCGATGAVTPPRPGRGAACSSCGHQLRSSLSVGAPIDFGDLAGSEPDRPPSAPLIFSEPPPPGLPPLDGSSEGFDLSAILEPGGDDELGGGFTFGGADDVFSAGEPPAAVAPEPDRVVNVEVAADGGWRARNPRGMVYELMSVDAVVGWLESKADISDLQISKDGGPFLAVAKFEELARRLGLTYDAPVDNSKPVEPEPLGLVLDTKAQANALSGRPGREAPAGSVTGKVPGGREPRAASSAQRQTIENPIGYRFVLVAILIAGLAVGAGAIVGLATGMMTLPATVAAAQAPEPPSPALEKAIEALEAERYASATRQLHRLAKSSQDPRVLRYLTVALHRENRADEARSALARYRRAITKKNGADGRQVREVRD